MLVMCCMSALLAGLSVLQARRDGLFTVFMNDMKGRSPDVEEGRSRGANKTIPPHALAIVHTPSQPVLQRSEKPQHMSPGESQYRKSLYGYYATS